MTLDSDLTTPHVDQEKEGIQWKGYPSANAVSFDAVSLATAPLEPLSPVPIQETSLGSDVLDSGKQVFDPALDEVAFYSTTGTILEKPASGQTVVRCLVQLNSVVEAQIPGYVFGEAGITPVTGTGFNLRCIQDHEGMRRLVVAPADLSQPLSKAHEELVDLARELARD